MRKPGLSALIFFFVVQVALAPKVAGAAVVLNPQTVVDLAISQGLQAKQAELTAQRAYLNLELARSVFDFRFDLATGYEYNEAQSITGFANPIDRTFLTTAGLTKKLSSGTSLTLSYERLQQRSTLSSFTATTRSPDAALDAVTLNVRQSLLGNAFGYADRLGVEIAEGAVFAALQAREENLEEIILSSMTLFWNAYTSQQVLNETLATREKYKTLVANLRRKSGFNLTAPGELPRAQAELEGVEQNVKRSSAAYLNALDALRFALKLEAGDEIRLDVPETLPPVPQLAPKSVEELRDVRVASTRLQNAERDLAKTASETRPTLDLVARAASTGVDEENSRSFAEMTAATRPTYFVGVELRAPLGSHLVSGRRADARVQLLQAQTSLILAKDVAAERMRSMEREVRSQYSIAKSAIEVVELRTRVVGELERSYRQGRQPLVELIRAYNDLFAAQLEKARAIGEYHTTLNRLAAARDELVSNQ